MNSLCELSSWAVLSNTTYFIIFYIYVEMSRILHLLHFT